MLGDAQAGQTATTGDLAFNLYLFACAGREKKPSRAGERSESRLRLCIYYGRGLGHVETSGQIIELITYSLAED